MENISEIVNCSFINNTGFYGGSIYLHFPGSLRIENCTFEKNTAEIGSIYFIQESNFISLSFFFN